MSGLEPLFDVDEFLHLDEFDFLLKNLEENVNLWKFCDLVIKMSDESIQK